MNIKNYLYSSLLLLSGLWTTSCTEQFETSEGGEETRGVISGRIAHFMVDGESSSVEGEDRIAEMKACVFADGKLAKVYDGINVTDGSFKLTVKETSGTLYMVANAEEAGAWHDMNVGTLTEEEWKQRTVTMKNDKAVSFFTGSLSLDEYRGGDSAPLVLKRGVARFDVRMATDEGVKLNGILLEHVATSAYLLPQLSVLSPETAFTSMEARFETPVSTNMQGIFYVYEQASEGMKAILDVTVDGSPKKLEAAIPSAGIKRNAVYTFNLHRDAVKVIVDEWDYEEDIDLTPGYTDKIVIDEEKSELFGAGVTEDGTGLDISYLPSEMKLYLKSKNELELFYQGDEIVTVTPLTNEQGQVVKNAFKIKKLLAPIGYVAKPSAIKFRRKGMTEVYEEDRIALSFEENPNKVSGMMTFDLNNTCDFDRYVENEVGLFELTEGKELEVDCGEEDPWLKSEYVDSLQAYRIIAGWKPNDPKGDGRQQTAKILIRDKGQRVSESVSIEEYTVIRRNWSIPVVKLQGIWWSKYNLRGDARKYEDQVLTPEDPAAKAGKSLFDYLNSCSDEEYFRIFGSAYQSGSSQGLTLTYDGKWHFPGFVTGNPFFMSAVDKKMMAPDGFELPSKDDFRSLVWSYDVGLGSKPTDWFSGGAWNGLRGNLKFENRTELTLNGGTMDVHHHAVFFTKNETETTPVSDEFVWYGPSCQRTETEALDGRYIFFATSTEENGRWTLNCSGNNNMFKFELYATGAEDRTHIIRCVKSPVVYQYE